MLNTNPLCCEKVTLFLHENYIVNMKYAMYIEDMFREGKPFSINWEYKIPGSTLTFDKPSESVLDRF